MEREEEVKGKILGMEIKERTALTCNQFLIWVEKVCSFMSAVGEGRSSLSIQ